jgi:hypothetical protein
MHVPASQDYAALTQPHAASEPLLGRAMLHLAPPAGAPPGAGFPEVVLLAHRATALSDLQVGGTGSPYRSGRPGLRMHARGGTAFRAAAGWLAWRRV